MLSSLLTGSCSESNSQFSRHFLQPIVTGAGVGTEGFEGTFTVVVEQGAVEAEGAGVGSINQRGGVAGAHLEEDAHGELAQGFPAKEAADVIEGITSDD